ncbi:MAG: amino acid adenylation domain-containing protein [Spirochaetales bacterium]|nr:amino acid adenylation domain-containing protein [Spirochaetales bacterium]
MSFLSINKITLFLSFERCSTVNTFFSAFIVLLLHRYFDRNQIILGAVTHGRTNRQDKALMGMFVNTLFYQIDIDPGESMESFFKRIHLETVGAARNQGYPFSLINQFARKNFDSEGLIDILFNYERFELKEPSIRYFSGYEVFPLLIRLCDWSGHGPWYMEFISRDSFFQKKEIEAIHRYLHQLIYSFFKGKRETLSQQDLLTSQERSQLLLQGKATRTFFDLKDTLVSLFERNVANHPDKKALIFGDDSFSYIELSRKVNQLAALLLHRGIKTESIVALLLPRSIEMLVAIYAVLKAGGAYLPLSLDNPQERLKLLLQESGARILIAGPEYNSDLDFTGDIIDPFEEDLERVPPATFPNISPEQLAYVIYTSGSTGTPKGVMVEHRNVISLLKAMQMRYSLNGADIFLLKTSYAFDVSIVEIFGILAGGGTLAIMDQDSEKDPLKIIECIQRYPISRLTFVPAMLELFLSFLEEGEIPKTTSLVTIFSAGEVLDKKTAQKCRTRLPGVCLENLYGPTETTVYVTWYNVQEKESEDSIPIGHAMPHVELYIADSRGDLSLPGRPGELLIGGDAVARGYLNNPAETKKRFIENPFGNTGRLYKSGDRVRRLPSGELLFLNRLDQQVKIRGYRIELEEIDRRLFSLKGVENGVTLAIQDSRGHRKLHSFIQCGSPLDPMDIKDTLKQTLPPYMIPSKIIQLKSFPLTHSGKIDRKKLAVAIPDSTSSPFVKPQPSMNDTEKKVARLWEQYLGVKNLGVKDDFFELGGDSIQLVETNTLLARDYNIAPEKTFQYTTIGQLAELLDAHKEPLSKRLQRLKRSIEEGIEENRLSQDQAFPEEYRQGTLELLQQDLSQKAIYQNILLTGATGFLGAHLLFDILHTTKARVHLLIRGEHEDAIKDRIAKNSLYFFGTDLLDLFPERIHCHCGDITQGDLGLNREDYGCLEEKIDCIINSAALTKHYGNWEEFEDVNVEGVRYLSQFCLRGRRKKMVQISTISVGLAEVLHSKKPVYFTEDHRCLGMDHQNVYLYTKSKAEQLLQDYHRDAGLTYQIFRVGNLMHHSANRIFQRNQRDSAFYRVTRSYIKLGIIPEMDFELSDFSFVDYTSRGILSLFSIPSLDNRIFHLSNPDRFSLQRMGILLKQAGCSVELKTLGEYLDEIYKRYNQQQNLEEISDLLLHSSLLKEHYFFPGLRIINTRTTELLRKQGMEWPPLKPKHLREMLAIMEN